MLGQEDQVGGHVARVEKPGPGADPIEPGALPIARGRMVAQGCFLRPPASRQDVQEIVLEEKHVLRGRGKGLDGSPARLRAGEDVGRPAPGGQCGRNKYPRHLLLGGIRAESARHSHVDRESIPVLPQAAVRGIARVMKRPAHLIGIAPTGLDLEPAAGDLTQHPIIVRRLAGA